MTPLLLFIDDIPEDAEIACWQLSRAGIQVDYMVAGSELEGQAAIAERMPAMILCDVVLPEWDCWDAWLKCAIMAPGVPFVLYSGTVSVADARLATERGLFGTAEKDLPAELIAVVRRGLGLL